MNDARPWPTVRRQVANMRHKALSARQISARMSEQAISVAAAITTTEAITPQTEPLQAKAGLLRAYHVLYMQAAGELDGRLPVTDLTKKEEPPCSRQKT